MLSEGYYFRYVYASTLDVYVKLSTLWCLLRLNRSPNLKQELDESPSCTATANTQANKAGLAGYPMGHGDC